MAYFQWTDQLDVGVGPMNEQHQRLIDIMNVLHDRAEAGAPRAELRGLVKSLADNTIRHFRAEEAYMDSVAYPEAARHKRIHEDLLGTLDQHRRAFEGGGSLGAEFFSFLKMWLSAHIKGIDKKYASHAGALPQRAA